MAATIPKDPTQGAAKSKPKPKGKLSEFLV